MSGAKTSSKSRVSSGKTTAAVGEGKAETQPVRPKQKPKAPHPLEALLGSKVINAEGQEVSPKTFASEDGVIGLYFSANWCPPCRTFTPRLKLLYDEMKRKERKFEVVYISFDSCAESFKEYLAKMPWWALDYEDSDKREEIASHFGISGVPVLLLLDAGTLEVISNAGRDVVSVDPRGDYFPWKEMPDIKVLEEQIAAALKQKEELERQEEQRQIVEQLEEAERCQAKLLELERLEAEQLGAGQQEAEDDKGGGNESVASSASKEAANLATGETSR